MVNAPEYTEFFATSNQLDLI